MDSSVLEVEVKRRVEKEFYANKDKEINSHKNRHDGRSGEKHKSRPWLVESVSEVHMSLCSPDSHSSFDAFLFGFIFSDANSLYFVSLFSMSRLRYSGRSYLGP